VVVFYFVFQDWLQDLREYYQLLFSPFDSLELGVTDSDLSGIDRDISPGEVEELGPSEPSVA
jgi:hypothetical protein